MNYKELNNAYKRINSWYGKKTKVLSIKTRPYNSYIVFSNIMDRVLNDNGKILYVWCNSEVNSNKKKQEYWDLLFTEKERQIYSNRIKFITIDKLTEVVEENDLVIFDDITIFSKISLEMLREAVEEVYWRSKKIIIYSCEKVFPIGEKMELVYLLDNLPMIEPRYITSRLRLEEDIPLSLYDYFRWFNNNKRKVLVFVPWEDRLNKVYNHYYNVFKQDDVRVVKFNKGQSNTFIKEVLQDNSEALVIVTNSVGDYISSINDLNIVLLFSDDNYYSYKKILYMCGALDTKCKITPEIILVSREVTSNMDKAKDMTRGFNKRLWEKRLIRQ